MKKPTLLFSTLLLFFNLFGQQQMNKNLFFDGQNRNYIIYIPSSYDGTNQVPLKRNQHLQYYKLHPLFSF